MLIFAYSNDEWFADCNFGFSSAWMMRMGAHRKREREEQ
jgi:hypothetical protein